MFSVIKNIYNKKTKGPRNCSQPQENRKSFFLQLAMFNVCRVTRGAHIEHL